MSDGLVVLASFGLRIAAGQVKMQTAAPTSRHRCHGIGIEPFGMARAVPPFHRNRQRPHRDVSRTKVPRQRITLPGGPREVSRFSQVRISITCPAVATSELRGEQVCHTECFRCPNVIARGVSFTFNGRSRLGQHSSGGPART
jgi:hypothetical protein